MGSRHLYRRPITLSVPVVVFLAACASWAPQTPLVDAASAATAPIRANRPDAPAITEPTGKTPTPRQEFTIIPAYEGFADFVQAAREPDTDLNNLSLLHHQHAIAPFEGKCRLSAVPYALENIPSHDADFDTLVDQVNQLRGSGVEQVVEDALRQASTRLAGPDVTACIYPQDPRKTFITRYMHGVNAAVVDSRRIVLLINPVDDWLDWVPYVVAHEYHHLVWIALHGKYPYTPVEILITEGEADYFARLVYPEVVAPWTVALTTEQEATQWQVIQEQLDGSGGYEFHRRVMFGQGEGVSHWAGYTIGFHIVRSYLETHPGLSPQEWTALEPEVILRDSGYAGEP